MVRITYTAPRLQPKKKSSDGVTYLGMILPSGNLCNGGGHLKVLKKQNKSKHKKHLGNIRFCRKMLRKRHPARANRKLAAIPTSDLDDPPLPATACVRASVFQTATLQKKFRSGTLPIAVPQPRGVRFAAMLQTERDPAVSPAHISRCDEGTRVAVPAASGPIVAIIIIILIFQLFSVFWVIRFLFDSFPFD